MVEKTLCTSAETEASSAITEAVSGVSAANHTAVDELEKRHRPPQSIYRLIITVTLIDFIPMTLHCTALSTWKAFIKKEKKSPASLSIISAVGEEYETEMSLACLSQQYSECGFE